jgi:homoserine kinase type II
MAVYTEVSDDDLVRFIDGYALGGLLSCKGIAEGVETTNYLVRTEQGPFILTLYERRVNRNDLPFFLGLMEHLAGNGLSCPTPVRDKQGAILQELAGRPAAMVTFLDGVWIRRPRVEHCAAVGGELAQLHLAGRVFTLLRVNALVLAGLRPLYDRLRDRADEIFAGLGGMIETELAHLEANWPRDIPQGVIHADLFPDNVFFLGDRLSGLIDFYFACNDALAYDLAICLNAWCFEADNSFNLTKGIAMLRAYDAVRPLEPAERASLPLLARGSALRFLLTRAYDWINTPEGALVKRKDPHEYLRRLHFHQSIASVSEYGLAAK